MALVTNAYGRLLAPVYSSLDALEAHVATLPDVQRATFAKGLPVSVPGSTLFPLLAWDGHGFVLNPKGPGRSREFNRTTVDALAKAPPSTT